jgi:UDP-glucuronate decarboxylase
MCPTLPALLPKPPILNPENRPGNQGKRVAETLMYAYQAQSGVDVRVARIFNTFGPRMNPYDGRVVSNFIIQAIQGE